MLRGMIDKLRESFPFMYELSTILTYKNAGTIHVEKSIFEILIVVSSAISLKIFSKFQGVSYLSETLIRKLLTSILISSFFLD